LHLWILFCQSASFDWALSEQVYLSAGVSVMLLALALVAVSTFDGSAKASTLSENESGAGVTDPTTATITKNDVDLAREDVVAHLAQQPTQVAAAITGSIPTDEQEAAAIMQGNGYEKDTCVCYRFMHKGTDHTCCRRMGQTGYICEHPARKQLWCHVAYVCAHT